MFYNIIVHKRGESLVSVGYPFSIPDLLVVLLFVVLFVVFFCGAGGA